MKGFAFVLLCALAAVQGRYTGVQQSTRALAALGDSPWLVHLRIATADSGYLHTCAGSLIDSRWVLTTASCVEDMRFAWVHFGVNVINPALVVETSVPSSFHPHHNLALINLNRPVSSSANHAPIALANAKSEIAANASFCVFGEDDSGSPGETLSCFEVSVEVMNGSVVVSSEEVAATSSDLGAPLVSGGVQVGILTATADADSVGNFTLIADHVSWIESVTGLNLSPESVPEFTPTPESVRIVN